MDLEKSARECRGRIFNIFLIKEGTWERSRWIQGGLGGLLFLCSAGAVVSWYAWLTGTTPLHIAVLWTVPVIGVIVVVPKRRTLIGAVLVIYVLYGLKAATLDGQPRAIYVVGVAAALLVLLLATAASGRHERVNKS